MEDQLKQIVRRLDSIEKSQNLIYKDRDILEDISVRIGGLEDKVRYLTERIEKLEKVNKADAKDLLSEVQEVKDNVEEVKKGLAE